MNTLLVLPNVKDHFNNKFVFLAKLKLCIQFWDIPICENLNIRLLLSPYCFGFMFQCFSKRGFIKQLNHSSMSLYHTLSHIGASHQIGTACHFFFFLLVIVYIFEIALFSSVLLKIIILIIIINLICSKL